ncbi:MAG: hypothetical protein FWG82_03990 [Oscillospiraceae bacterium]|nr:hypothetical protein [Oscillospiraceae bacterium]
MKKRKKLIVISLVTVFVLTIAVFITLLDYYPTMEYDRILFSMDEVLTAHEEIQGRYENPTIIRGASGNYFVVFDLTYDPVEEMIAKIRTGKDSYDPLFDLSQEEGMSMGYVRVRNRYFEFGKTKILEYQFASNYTETPFPGLIRFRSGDVDFGKLTDPDIAKIEIYVENILAQTWLRNKDERFGTKDFFLIELDSKVAKKNFSHTRMVYYNSKGEVLYMS